MAPIEYRTAQPNPLLAGFVESFWMLVNPSDEAKDVVVLPDGRFDVFFSCSASEPFRVALAGLGSEPSPGQIAPQSVRFAVSLHLLAVEYLLLPETSSQVNQVSFLPTGFWDISADDLTDFDQFCKTVSTTLTNRLPAHVDEKKQKLFALIHASQGSATVAQLSAAAGWSSRQINRYFTHWFGMPLKAYCTILRYRASFNHLRAGQLFPEQNFTDQAHFIRDVKRYSGVTPKELAVNKDDRFIQFSTLPRP